MFCPSNDALQSLTEKTKLLAHKCTIRVSNSETATPTQPGNVHLSAPQSGNLASIPPNSALDSLNGKCRLNCLCSTSKRNFATLNRIFKNRCGFMAANVTQFASNTLPKKKSKKATTRWYIKVIC